jgi:hypothetical protein
MYVQSADEVKKAHEEMYSYVEDKMKKVRLGLKSYRYFDQAKALADKVNDKEEKNKTGFSLVLNESVLDTSSSMALSVYSPDNLANLLEDEVELSKADKIAIAKANLLKEQQAIN